MGEFFDDLRRTRRQYRGVSLGATGPVDVKVTANSIPHGLQEAVPPQDGTTLKPGGKLVFTFEGQ